MLVFDFKCTKCGVIDERFVKDLDDTNFQFCHVCGDIMDKLVSSPAMVKGNFFNDKCGTKR